MEKTFIPDDNSLESIKMREKIIRDFYLSTLAVLQLDAILAGAKKVSIPLYLPLDA